MYPPHLSFQTFLDPLRPPSSLGYWHAVGSGMFLRLCPALVGFDRPYFCICNVSRDGFGAVGGGGFIADEGPSDVCEASGGLRGERLLDRHRSEEALGRSFVEEAPDCLGIEEALGRSFVEETFGRRVEEAPDGEDSLDGGDSHL